MNLKSILIVSALGLVGAANADILASWTFETSVPTTAGPHAAEVGFGSASSNTGGAFSNPVGNGSAESFSANGWDLGEYFQFTTSSTGSAGLKVSFDQISSGTGPASFGLSYSTDGSTFVEVGTYTVIANTSPNNWSAGTPISGSSYSFDLSSATTLDNQANVAFRLSMLTTTSANGGTVASGGTSRVDNFTIEAQPVPEPASMAVLGLGAAALLRRRRKA